MRRSINNAMGVSAVTHVAVFFIVLFVMARMPDPVPEQRPRPSGSIIWMPRPGPGGGGGGGGNRMPEPARRAESPGRDRVTVPAPKPAAPSNTETPPTRAIDIPALPAASGITELPGVVSEVPTASLSQGPGSDGAGSRGRGGFGSGDGPGVGDGVHGGAGGGSYQPGSDGVSYPKLLREVPPSYSNAALQARIQGTVELLAEVLPDGSVGHVWVTRSLDRNFGLDQEAIRTVRQWRFDPARQHGKPVKVVVPIQLTFTIR